MKDPFVQVKTRSDAWGADIPEDVAWKLYDETAHLSWVKAVKVVESSYDLPVPTRSAWYRFVARMRKRDSVRRIERVAQSVAEAEATAEQAGVTDQVFVETLKALALDAALSKDKSASSLTQAAVAIWDRAQKERELELKQRAQATRDEQLRLAREKFEAAEKRLAATAEVVADSKLTEAERMAKLREIYGI